MCHLCSYCHVIWLRTVTSAQDTGCTLEYPPLWLFIATPHCKGGGNPAPFTVSSSYDSSGNPPCFHGTTSVLSLSLSILPTHQLIFCLNISQMWKGGYLQASSFKSTPMPLIGDSRLWWESPTYHEERLMWFYEQKHGGSFLKRFGWCYIFVCENIAFGLWTL